MEGVVRSNFTRISGIRDSVHIPWRDQGGIIVCKVLCLLRASILVQLTCLKHGQSDDACDMSKGINAEGIMPF